jgi:hypothetical protein
MICSNGAKRCSLSKNNTRYSQPVESELEHKLNFIRQQQLLIENVGQTQYDSRLDTVSCLIDARMKTELLNQDLLMMPTDEVRVRLIGFPDSTKRAYDGIKSKEQKRMDTPEKEFLHLEFRIKTSRQ